MCTSVLAAPACQAHRTAAPTRAMSHTRTHTRARGWQRATRDGADARAPGGGAYGIEPLHCGELQSIVLTSSTLTSESDLSPSEPP